MLALIARGLSNREIAATPGGQRGDGQDAHQPRVRQDRRARPCPGRPLRLHARPRRLSAAMRRPFPRAGPDREGLRRRRPRSPKLGDRRNTSRPLTRRTPLSSAANHSRRRFRHTRAGRAAECLKNFGLRAGGGLSPRARRDGNDANCEPSRADGARSGARKRARAGGQAERNQGVRRPERRTHLRRPARRRSGITTRRFVVLCTWK